MVSVCTVPAREGRLCEHFDGYKTINRIPLPLEIRVPLENCHIIPSSVNFFTCPSQELNQAESRRSVAMLWTTRLSGEALKVKQPK